MHETQCPKCKNQMILGFVPDSTYGTYLVGSWHKGQPKKSYWTGTKMSKSVGIPIGAYRCSNCGYIELYADAKFAAK